MQTAALRRKHAYDLRVREKTFVQGNWVWYYCPRRFKGRSPKWQRLYSGPFLITKVIPPANCVIQLTKHSQPKVVHIDKLKAWNGDPPLSWLDPPALANEQPVAASDDARSGEREDALPAHQICPEPVADQNDSDDTEPLKTAPAPARARRECRPPRHLADYVA